MTDTQKIKKALINEFGKENVISVRKGTGTACCWTYIQMKKVTDKINSSTVESIAVKALDGNVNTYLVDDGYNSVNNCILVSFYEIKSYSDLVAEASVNALNSL